VSFLYPAFFWTFVGLIPLAAIYFLKVRPRRKATTAMFLWEKVFTENQSSSLFSRLRDMLSLLLLVLVFSAVVFALTWPEFSADERKDMLILIDNSASMSAGRRLEEAKEAARDIVRALNGNQRAAVATLSADVTYETYFTDNPKQLIDAINGIEQSDMSIDSRAVAALGGDEAMTDQHRILLFSDGCGSVGKVPDNIELFKIGERLDNIGIVASDMQFLPGGENRLGFYFQIASSYKEPVGADLVLSFGNEENIEKVIPLVIEPGVNKPGVYDIDGGEAGRWIARLEIEDAMEKDNVAYMAAASPKAVRVRVAASESFFFEHSVLAFSRSSQMLELCDDNEDVVLCQGADAEGKAVIVFAPNGQSKWWDEVGDEIESVVPRVLIEEHPTLRYCDMSGIEFAGARELTAPAGALVLVESDSGVPLVYQAMAGKESVLVINMDPGIGDFYLSPMFPVMVNSGALGLTKRHEMLCASYSPEAVVGIPGAITGEVTEVFIDGLEESIETSKETFGPLNEPGFCEFVNGAGRWLIACSLMSVEETLLDNSEASDTSKAISRGTLPGILLTAFAIILLIIESMLYHRRKVG
jgi:hypothetical protein